MSRGKRYQPEQVVNLLWLIEGCGSEREDDGSGVQGSGDRGADIFSLAQGVWRVADRPGEAAEGTGAGERKAEASGGQPEPG